MNVIKSTIAGMSWKQLFCSILFTWMLINLFQAIYTEILSDEAYYFLYSENLAWGYFDHPPMVGLLIYLGNLIFDGNLGVRIFPIILQALTLIILWKTIEEKDPTIEKVELFFILSASMVMFTAYGFIMAPDVPLLFFLTLFLYAYQRFLRSESWQDTLLLAISMAGMIYSKYHAFIIIGFVVLSNFKLLTKYKAWIVLIITSILLIPHIYWQVTMDYPSFKYHLVGRSFGFQWDEFLGHLPNQLVMFNPLTVGALLYVLFKYKAKDTFERGLYFQIIGFQVFFFLMTFKGYVQPHWTVPTTMAMIIILYRNSLHDEKLKRFIKKWILPSILLIIIARILLVSNLLPARLDFYGKKEKSQAVQEIAGNLPVVFTGSFQWPSNYHYFTSNESFVISGHHSRLTQFDIWEKELQYQGKPVFIFGQVNTEAQLYSKGDFSFHGYFARSFQTANRVKINYTLTDTNTDFFPGDTLVIQAEILNPDKYEIDFNHPEFPVSLGGLFIQRRSIEMCGTELNKELSILHTDLPEYRTVKIVVPDLPEGDYLFTLSLFNALCAAVNSEYIPVKIKQR